MRDLENKWLDEYAQRRRKETEAVMDSEGSVSGRGVQWVVIGEPGSDKHVYGYRLSKLLRSPYISVGSLVRKELSPRSSIYKQISNALNQGRLVPVDVIIWLLSNRLVDGHYRGESGFILDGLPRNRFQAGILAEIADIDLVISFKCPDKFTANSLLSSTSSGQRGMESSVSSLLRLRNWKRLLSFQVPSAQAET